MTDKEKFGLDAEQNPQQEEETTAASEQLTGEENLVTGEEASAAEDTAVYPVGTDAEAAPAAAAVPPRKGAGAAWMAVSLVLAVILIVVLIKPPFQSSNATVASVNGETIKKDELYDKLVAAGGPQTLDNMISEKLVNQELNKAKITVSQTDYDKEFDKIKASFPSEDQFASALQQAGMTEADLKQNLVSQVKLTKLLEPKVKVTDDDIKTYFETNKAAYDTQEQVRASHILVATKEEAEAIKKQLEGGADFAQLAKEKSLDPGSKDQGGDLNFFPRGTMEKPFEDAAFSQKKGELGIVQSSNGFHVIKVTDHKDAHTATLDEKKAEIKDQLIGQKVNDMAASYLADLKAKAKITNTLAADPAASTGAAAAAEPAAATTTN